MNKEQILITGGTGYIGSHALISLYKNGYEPVIIDNLTNSKISVLDKIKKICNFDPIFYKGDIRDEDLLISIFKQHKINSVMHFAGLKSVAESFLEPKKYYENNVNGTKILLKVMTSFNCNYLIFSSSATVYGYPNELPINENHQLSALNPYGENKIEIESICKEITNLNPNFSCVALRYFNPIGCHPSGLIGEEPSGVPNNIMPIICDVALGVQPELIIFGDDYDTKDGTCIRDYIHVEDLAEGHLAALKYAKNNSVFLPINLGTGIGNSVKDLIIKFEEISKKKINYIVGKRREGDAPELYGDSSLASKLFLWNPNYKIDDMIKHSWNWKKKQLKEQK